MESAKKWSAIREIASSAVFEKATEQRKLLEYLARASIEGRSLELTQALIANELGFRKAGRVAVTLGRLRDRLKTYYLSEGAVDVVQVRIPERSYQVLFDPSMTLLPGVTSPQPTLLTFKSRVEDLSRLYRTHDKRNDRTRTWIESSARFSDLLDELRAKEEFESFFEIVSQSEEKLTLAEMRSLADALGVSPVLLDSSLSPITPKDCLLLRLPGASGDLQLDFANDHCEVGNFALVQSRERGYGLRARYFVPDYQLTGTNPAFVYLILQPGGSSDSHGHGGEELLLLLRGGPIEIHFHESGEHIILREGDCAHFYAEQIHSAHNPSSEDAEIFIERFHQHRKESERGRPLSLEELQESLRSTIRNSGSCTLDAFARAWILESTGLLPRSLPSSSNPDGIPDYILNGFGLARFLARLPPGKVPWKVESIATGDQKIYRSDIETRFRGIPKLYLPLLYGFLFPSVTKSLVLRRDANDDWIALERIEDTKPAAGVQHAIPRRTLSCSDLAVAFLTLDPGKVTPAAEHFGSELIIPIRGTATIELKNTSDKAWVKACAVSPWSEMAYFRSDQLHRIGNFTEQTVQFLICRCYASHATKGSD